MLDETDRCRQTWSPNSGTRGTCSPGPLARDGRSAAHSTTTVPSRNPDRLAGFRAHALAARAA